jgi:hypothetical protein
VAGRGAAGAAMTFDEAMAYALGDDRDVPALPTAI